MMTVDDAIDAALAREGGYSNNPNDSGGETNYGITVAVARQQGYNGSMRIMPRSFAVEVYRRLYVLAPGFDKVAAISGCVAAEMIDTGINMGPAVATRFLQRALGALSDLPLTPDGNLGAVTLGALQGYVGKRGPEGERRLVAVLNAQQGVRYLELTEGRLANRAFLFGWLARILP